MTATGQQTNRVATTSFTDPANYVHLTHQAAGPLTYNHATGGGAYNNGTVGRGGDGLPQNNSGGEDMVSSLEGGDSVCGDIVTFLTRSQIDNAAPAGAKTIRLDYAYMLDTTGQTGLALGSGYDAPRSTTAPSPMARASGIQTPESSTTATAS